ncbi:MAG: cell surface protein, partial [Methanobacteriales archaeon HGW-Methanobacteriales-1]
MGPVSAVAGQDMITYTILVGNNGPSVARNVIVNDAVGFLSGVQYSLNGGSWNAWGGSISLGNLSSGNVTTILIRGLVPASTLGTLNNTVIVNSTTTDPYLSNNTASAITNVNTVADVYVTKSAPVSVVAGQSLTYNLSVGNVGPSVARNVNIYDILASEILNAQYSLNNGSTWFNWTGSLAMGDMNSGSVINILIRGNVSAAALGTINNTASVNSTTFDNFTDNNTASTSTNITTVADVYVTKSGSVSAVAGQDTVNYLISVGNVGPSVARSVILSDMIPAMIFNPQFSINGGLNWSVWNGTFVVGDLNPGDSLQIIIRGNLSSDALGVLNNTVNVNSSTFDPYLVNNTASALTVVSTVADVFVVKSGSLV